MILQNLYGFLPRVKDHWLGNLFEHGVDQHGYTGNMIEVGVSHEYMANFRHLLETQLRNSSSAINQNIVVNQQRSCAQIRTDPSTTP